MAMTSDDGRGMTPEERAGFLTTGTIFPKVATTIENDWPVLSPACNRWNSEAFVFSASDAASLVTGLALTVDRGSAAL